MLALVQNLDAENGRWREDRPRALIADRRARSRWLDEIVAACQRHRLAGVHIDLEEIDEGNWTRVAALAGELAARLRPLGLETAIDVPSDLDARSLIALGRAADRVVVMAYDEHDDQGEPGAIASARFVDEAIARAASIPAPRRTIALGIYGYDWVGEGEATPLSFVDGAAAAKEAEAEPAWDDDSGNLRFGYRDDEGEHEVWMLDAATLANQLASARSHDIATVALWRLGGEDPGVWSVLSGAIKRSDLGHALESVPADARVTNLGDGPFLSLALSPEGGTRSIDSDGHGGVRETWRRLPSPFVVRRAGIHPGDVALTFDDGPDPRSTRAILDTLHATGTPASFFVVGMNAARSPDLVRRALDEGHEIGNHSFTHPDIDRVDDARLRLELEMTSRLVENLVGRRPLLYRPPSLADIEPRSVAGATAFARAGSLGYLVVDADVDPRDFEPGVSSDEIARRVLDGAAQRGGVILLHDGGGDRRATVAALPRIIEGLRARGQRIVPLAALVGKTRDEVMPPSAPRPTSTRIADGAVFGAVASGLRIAVGCLGVGLLLIAGRTVLMLALAIVAELRRSRRRTTAPCEVIDVIVPVFNERDVVLRTLDAVLASDVPVRAIVVDDGSTDGTADLLRRSFRDEPRVTVITQKNQGKAAALRAGVAAATSDVIVALDGDTLFFTDTVRHLVAPFADPRVAAVAGTVEVGNDRGWLGRFQSLEYHVQQEVERRAWDALGALPVVPGAVGAWRRAAIEFVGGFSSSTLAEDADLAMTLCRRGWRIVHAPSARALTEAPSTVSALLKQRARWSFGVLQAMWKHRGALIDPRAGAFGRVVLPMMIVQQVLVPLLTPAALLAVVFAIATGSWLPSLLTALALFCVELSIASTACALGRGGWRLLLWLPLARIVYRPLLFLVLTRALGRVVDGIPLGWNKLARRGSVRM